MAAGNTPIASAIGRGITKVRSMFQSGTDIDAQAGNDLATTAQQQITEKWLYVKNQYTSYHQQALICYLMYAGLLWIRWDATKKMYILDTPEDEYVPTPNINRFSPAVDAVCSNFNALPEIECTPRNDRDSDQNEIADIINSLLEFLVDDSGLRDDFEDDDDKTGLAAQLFVLGGSAFTEVWPEQTTVGQIPVMQEQQSFGCSCPNCGFYTVASQPPPPIPTQCPECGQMTVKDITTVTNQVPTLDETTGQPQLQPVTRFRIRCQVRDAINAYPRPGALGLHNSPYFIWAERFSIDEIRQRLREDAPDFDPQPDNEMPDGWTQQLDNQLQYFYQGFMSGSPNVKDSAMLIRMIVMPQQSTDNSNPGMKEFPDGLEAWYCNGQCVSAKPFDKPDHPYTMGRYMRIPKLFFGRSIAFDLSPIQKEINGYESLIKLHAQSSSCEPIIYDENTIIEGGITNRGDKVIKIRSLGPGTIVPQRLHHEALSQVVADKLEMLHSEMENISGAVSVFRGQQEGDVTAASAISQLRGQAELMFSKPQNNWNGLWKQTFYKIIRLVQKYWSLEDVLKIVGQTRQDAAVKFLKCDLASSIRITTTTNGLPRTRDERRQEMLQLFTSGALDISDLHVKEKLFELFGETGMFETFNADAARARHENRQMMEGITVTVKPELEDLPTHATIHLDAIKGLDFDKLPPNIQTIFITHLLQTQKAMMQEAMAASKAGAAGSPPPSSKGPSNAPPSSPAPSSK